MLPPERNVLVMNWASEGKGLPRAGIEGALKRETGIAVPYPEEMVVSSIMHGKPATLELPLNPLSAFLEDLACPYSKKEQSQHPSQDAGEGLKRVNSRAGQAEGLGIKPPISKPCVVP